MHYFFLYNLILFFSYSQLINCQEQISINYNSPVISFEKELIDLGSFMQYDDSSSRCEFIFTKPSTENQYHMLQQICGQMVALAQGKPSENHHHHFSGNRPSILIYLKCLKCQKCQNLYKIDLQTLDLFPKNF